MNRHGSMNRIYRLVWSAVRSVWIPVAETARGRGKRSSGRLVGATLSLTCALAQASPSGGQVVAGSGRITQSGATTTITQATQNLSLTWTRFNIAPQQTVNFVQPSTSAIAVNRILGTNGTQILGYLHANGQVFLINPNGIVFGPTAEVNVGGLVASTLELADGATGSPKSFSGTGSGSVVNQGTITAAQGGYVVLLGSHVSNEGVISAQLGSVALAAGSAVTLTFDGTGLVRLQVDESVLNSVAQNGGLIRADGGQVIMSAGARNALMASVVNNTGVIEARTVDTHDGTITLLGGMTAGTVKVAGTLDASASEGGNGGRIDTSAAHVEVAGGARVTTAARYGLFGSWLIDPQDYTVAASGGDVTGAELSSDLATTDITLQSSAGGTPGSGNINVNDAVAWSANTTLTLTASNNVNVNANITASGATAGLIINPNTGNGSGSSAEMPSGSGIFNLAGAFITLSGATPHLSIAGTTYTVINALGAPGSLTATDLQGVNGNLAASYALGSDIDATATSAWNGGAGFTPIGTSTTPFVGTFDGLGHTLSNLTIHLPTTNYVGLFGYIGLGSVVQNVGLVGGSVSGGIIVGELVGYSAQGSINNSYATGNVTGTNNVGGLVGFNEGSISNSYATGNVSGVGSYIGGLVGDNSYGAISTSYATGNVSATYDSIGGLVGANFGGSINDSYATGSANSGAAGIDIGGLVGESFGGSISNSYATGNVGGNQVGGLVGALEGGCIINNSYATGSVSGGSHDAGGLVGVISFGSINDAYATGTVSAATDVGGLVGFNESGTIGTSYWNTSTNPTLSNGAGNGSSGAAQGLTTAQMQSVTSFSGFGFTATPGVTGNNWVMVDTDGALNNANGVLGATFPMLASEYSTVITNAHQLQLIAMGLSANYTLAANVNAAGTDTSTTLGDVWSTSGGFVPIGGGSASFSGSFDGLGHTISGLTMNLAAASNVGLFGSTSSAAVVQNVGLVGGSVYGYINVGGLIGINEGAVRNSYATGSVLGAAKIGGLVGFNNGGAISSSHAGGQVNGNNYVGGLVGYNQNAAISNSYSTATAGGLGYGSGYNIGGLLGYNYHGTINNSFATGAISGAVNVGGLVGGSYASATNSSHATGTVTEPAYMFDETGREGGLVGFNYGGSTITNSYATGVVTGAEAVGGLVGENGLNAENATITNSYATGRVIGIGSSRGGYGYGNVGGLVGSNYGAITTSYATGIVNSTGWMVGGLVGMNAGSITNSHAGIGSVTGTGSDVGGLVGNDFTGNNHTGTVANSYATGNVTGGASVGGLVGAGYGTVSNSHAAGNVTSSGSNVGGLEGSNDGAPISDSYASGDVTGASNVGGLAGQSGGVITNSYATGSVTGTGFFVGGLVGSQYSSVIDSHATGDVTGVRNVGGLVGYDNPSAVVTGSYATGATQGTVNVGGLIGINYGGAVGSSHASGTVTGSSSVGGLVGFNYRNAPITNSYATGTVSGSSYVGGFVGNNYGGAISNSYSTGSVSGGGMDSGGLVGFNSGMISNSYATGRVAGAGDSVGGLVGSNQDQGTVTDSFWNSDVDAIGIGAGTSTGAQGLSSAGMMTMSNFSSAGWNISDTGGSGDVWRIYAGNTAPLLLSFLTPLTVTAQATTHTYTGTPVTDLTDARYSIGGAAASGHIFNLNNPYNGAVNVGTYGAQLYSDQQGYDISVVNAVLRLTPATLTVTANGASRTYGQVNPVLSGTVTGFVGTDTLASATTGSETYATAATASSNVGTYAITGAGLTANDGNYIFSFAAADAAAFTITPATLIVNGEVAASRIYNGTTATTLTGGTLTGMVSGDTVTLTQAGHFTSSDAGTGVPVAATDTLGGAGAGNYVLAEPTDIVANITPATLTYAAAAASFTAGQTPSGLSGTLTGFVAGETQLSATTGSLAWITTAGAESAPGRYAIDGSGLTATNYIFVDAPANAIALTLLAVTEAPVNLQNVVTSIEANLPSSQTNIQLAMLDVSANIAVTQSTDADTDVATEPTDSAVLDDRSVHRAMVPSLHVVRGGLKLPANTVDISLR